MYKVDKCEIARSYNSRFFFLKGPITLVYDLQAPQQKLALEINSEEIFVSNNHNKN